MEKKLVRGRGEELWRGGEMEVEGKKRQERCGERLRCRSELSHSLNALDIYFMSRWLTEFSCLFSQFFLALFFQVEEPIDPM